MRRILLLAVAPLVISCSQEPEKSGFIARVGDSYLTRDGLNTHGDTASDSSRIYRLVNEWVSAELLYREALSKGLAGRADVAEKLREVERQLLINSLLDEELYQDTSSISDEAVAAYFEENMADFALREEVALVSYLHFDDRQQANTFRSGVLRGTPWTEAVRSARINPELTPHLLLVVENQYVNRARLYPDELWKVARSLQPERVSFVISTDSGYYVLFLHGFRRKGETPDLRYVADEVRARLIIRERQQRYDQMLQDLRRKFPVEVRLGTLTGTKEGTE